VAQLYPGTLGSLSVASYDSQGHGVGILSRLHTGKLSGNVIATTNTCVAIATLLESFSMRSVSYQRKSGDIVRDWARYQDILTD
jgi:hypothetical protein